MWKGKLVIKTRRKVLTSLFNYLYLIIYSSQNEERRLKNKSCRREGGDRYFNPSPSCNNEQKRKIEDFPVHCLQLQISTSESFEDPKRKQGTKGQSRDFPNAARQAAVIRQPGNNIVDPWGDHMRQTNLACTETSKVFSNILGSYFGKSRKLDQKSFRPLRSLLRQTSDKYNQKRDPQKYIGVLKISPKVQGVGRHIL